MEEVCYNAANKVIINHWGGGRRKSPVAESISDTKSGSDFGAANSGQGNTLNALELLNRFESPSNKAGWLAFFRVIEDVNEAHSRTFDYYVDEIFNRLDVVFRQVDIWKWSVSPPLHFILLDIIASIFFTAHVVIYRESIRRK